MPGKALKQGKHPPSLLVLHSTSPGRMDTVSASQGAQHPNALAHVSIPWRLLLLNSLGPAVSERWGRAWRGGGVTWG